MVIGADIEITAINGNNLIPQVFYGVTAGNTAFTSK